MGAGDRKSPGPGPKWSHSGSGGLRGGGRAAELGRGGRLEGGAGGF